MNATAKKSAKKSIVAKKTTKTTVKAATLTKKPAKSTLKAVAVKLEKTIKGALKPASKTTTSSAKTIVTAVNATVKKGAAPAAKKTAKPGAKPAVKSAAVKKAAPAAKPGPKKPVNGRNSAKTESKLTSKPVATPVKKASVAVVKAVATVVAKVDSRAAELDARMSVNKAAAIFVDKIQKSVVSKVSEVATKTTKPTPVVPSDAPLLTEAQIIKMSDKDYMNAAQLAFFKARLQQLEKDLLKNAGETTEHLRETVLVPDPADRATIEEEHALELRTRDRERKLLKKVQQSIASIDSGDYGWCEETGEPIGIPRLLARPTATLSLEAQQRRELKQKLYGD